MTGTALGVWLMLSGVAAPPGLPAPLPRVEGADDALDRDAWLVAEWMADTAERVSAEFVTPVPPNDLLVAGLAEIYAAAGSELPAHFRDKVTAATTSENRMRAVYQARLALGRADAVDGMKAVVVAAAGFNERTDPYCGLMSARGGLFATSDAEFGLGFELEGATGTPWLVYQLELVHPTRAGRPAAGERLTAPAELPWTVRRVIPGGPAARAGLRPGDVVTRLDDVAVTARSSPSLFRKLVVATDPELRDFQRLTPLDASKPVRLTVTRAGSPTPMAFELERTGYTPDSVVGVSRRSDGTWDFMLDRTAKVGYVRVGPIESGAEGAFRAAMEALVAEGARGLVLDLRWCPGGYVEPTGRIASSLLPPGKVVAKIEYRDPERQTDRDPSAEPGDHPAEWEKLPVVVLVGPETTGGGEMIAAALQDHGRAVIAGQRTFGKANVMTPLGTRFRGVIYRVSSGYSLRPTGKPRHRYPDSKPTDNWGVRPDLGCEIPVTPDLSAKLREQAERLAIRPSHDRGAVVFDDPYADPQKLVAVRLLTERPKK